MSERDYGHTMFAGRSFYAFQVGLADHDALQQGRTSTKSTEVALPRKIGDNNEYQEAKQTAALMAMRHGGMPTYVKPIYREQ